MTQKAQLQKEKKGKYIAGPATPVIITGGGSGSDVPGLVRVGNDPTGKMAPIKFDSIPPNQQIWLKSVSEQCGAISEVYVNNVPQQPPTHPAQIVFKSGESVLFSISETPSEMSEDFVLTLSVSDPDGFRVTQSDGGDGAAWISSVSAVPEAYDRVIVCGQETRLPGEFKVDLRFEVGP